MNLERARRAALDLTLVFLITVPSVAVLAFVAASGRRKLLGAVLGLALFLIAAYITRNPRLLTLWGLALTLPLSLAKRFGMILFKGGGENSFQLEVSEAFLLILLGFQLWDILVSRKRHSVRFPRFLWFWLAIMVMGVIVMLTGEWQRPPAHEVVRMFKMLLLFTVLVNEMRRPQQILHAVGALTVGVFANCAVAGGQYYKGGSLGLQILGEANPQTIDILAVTSIQGATVFRVSGLLLHPNLFGVYLAALLPLGIAGFLATKNLAFRLFFLSTVGIGMAALIATNSRSGWVSAAGSVALLLVLLFRNTLMRRRSMLLIGVAAATLLLVTGIFHKQIATRLFRSKAEATTAREMWKGDARRMIAAKPLFGHGLNNYVHALPPYMRVSTKFYGDPPWLPPVHHIYYLWFAETGIVGFALHLLLWGSIVRMGIRNLKVRNEMLYAINAACLGAMVAFAIDGMFSFSLRVGNLLRVYWFLAALIYAIRYWHWRNELLPAVEETAETRPPAGELQPLGDPVHA